MIAVRRPWFTSLGIGIPSVSWPTFCLDRKAPPPATQTYKSRSLLLFIKKKNTRIWKNVVGRIRFSDVSRISFTLSCCLGRETRGFQAPKRSQTVTRLFFQSTHVEGVRFRTLRPIGKFFQNGRVDRMSIRGPPLTPSTKRYTKCPVPVSRPPGRVAARTQLMLFRPRVYTRRGS